MTWRLPESRSFPGRVRPDCGRRGTQCRSCPPACGLLLYLTAQSATPPAVNHHCWHAKGIQTFRTSRVRCCWHWGGWCSEIKEEAAGRGTFAEPFAPVPSAHTKLGGHNELLCNERRRIVLQPHTGQLQGTRLTHQPVQFVCCVFQRKTCAAHIGDAVTLRIGTTHMRCPGHIDP